jgi:hypothetical protein
MGGSRRLRTKTLAWILYLMRHRERAVAHGVTAPSAAGIEVQVVSPNADNERRGMATH